MIKKILWSCLCIFLITEHNYFPLCFLPVNIHTMCFYLQFCFLFKLYLHCKSFFKYCDLYSNHFCCFLTMELFINMLVISLIWHVCFQFFIFTGNNVETVCIVACFLVFSYMTRTVFKSIIMSVDLQTHIFHTAQLLSKRRCLLFDYRSIQSFLPNQLSLLKRWSSLNISILQNYPLVHPVILLETLFLCKFSLYF